MVQKLPLASFICAFLLISMYFFTELAEGDHLGRVYKSIRRAELGIDGTSVKAKRTSTMAPADRLDIRNSKEVNCTRKLISLQRTLRVSRKEF